MIMIDSDGFINRTMNSAGDICHLVVNGIIRRPSNQTSARAAGENPSNKLEYFEETMLPHFNSAYNLARWLLRNEHDASDVVQESYLRAFRFFDSYRGGDPKAWILAIVRNTYRSWRRREAAARQAAIVFGERAHFRGADELEAEEHLLEETKARTLRDCIRALAPKYREILVMREMEEMSYRQIACVAGVPIGTVMSRLSRARKRLEQRLLPAYQGAISRVVSKE